MDTAQKITSLPPGFSVKKPSASLPAGFTVKPRETTIPERMRDSFGLIGRGVSSVLPLGADVAVTGLTGNPYLGGLSSGGGTIAGKYLEQESIKQPMKFASRMVQPMIPGMPQPSYDPNVVPYKDMASGHMNEAIINSLFGTAGAKLGTTAEVLAKSRPDWMYRRLIEPAAQVAKKEISTFGKGIQGLAKKIGIKNETSEAIKKYGYDAVTNPEIAEEAADNAYKAAWQNTPTGFGRTINAKSTLDKLDSLLSKIDSKILKTDPVYSKLDSYRKILRSKQPEPKGFYSGRVPTPTQLKRQFKGESLQDIAEEVRVSPETFNAVRDGLSRLYKESGSDRAVFETIDSMYDSAEKSGIKGLNQARKMFREAKEMRAASKNAMKLEKFDENSINTELKKVMSDPAERIPVIKKLTPYLGKDMAENIVSQALRRKEGLNIRSGMGRAAWNVAQMGGIGLLGGALLGRQSGNKGQDYSE